jgi:RHH-type rel operon transcriptional repressor/antitoxin RelB
MQISLRLKEPIVSRLNSLSKKTGRSKTAYITEAIIEHLSELEAIYLAEERLEKIKAGNVKTISWKDVQKKNAL